MIGIKEYLIRELIADPKQIFLTNIIRIVWHTVKRISNEILRVKDSKVDTLT